MELSEISKLVEDYYGLNIKAIEKIKNVFKISDGENCYCLKLIKYEWGHFLFILKAMEHLQNNGFQFVPSIKKTLDGSEYIKFDKYYAYLNPWINARMCSYDNPIDVKTAAAKLAELHIKSRGFTVTEEMKPRIGWLKWAQVYKTRIDEINNFGERINEKVEKTDFDWTYLGMMDEEIIRGNKAIEDLMQNDYIQIMSKEVEKRGFCHHDYAHHNVLIDENSKLFIIDFDYCILDSHLHDLASLMIRRMKNGSWDIENAREVLDAYSSVYRIHQEEIPLIAAFMEFPQEYWQVGIQYYWERQNWGEEFFNNKLSKIKEDRLERQEFVEELLEYKYGGN